MINRHRNANRHEGLPKLDSLARRPPTLTPRAVLAIIRRTEAAATPQRGSVSVEETRDIAKALAFHTILTSAPTENLIANLSTTVTLHHLGAQPLPITINSDPARPTCYLCCPSVAYIDYARAELRHFSGFQSLSRLLDAVLRLGYPLIRAAQ